MNVNKFSFKDKFEYTIGEVIKVNYQGERFKCTVVSCLPVSVSESETLFEITVELPLGYALEINDEVSAIESYYDVTLLGD